MDRNRKQELIYFTRQYETYRGAYTHLSAMLKSLSEGKPLHNKNTGEIIDDLGTNPEFTEKLTNQILYFKEKIDLIEGSAEEACSEYKSRGIWSRLIVISIINKWNYKKMKLWIEAACSEEDFNSAMQKYFDILDERRG